MTSRRNFIGAAGGLSVAGLTTGLSALPINARAQAMPEVARIVVGFPPGGPTDVFARRIAERLRGTLAANVVVDNKPGAGGQVGVLNVKDAPADGTVLLLTPAGMITVYPHSYSRLGYRADDVLPVTTATFIVHGLGIGPGVPESVRTLAEFITWARANPDRASVGSPGAGSMPHLLVASLSRQTGANLNHIPFLGSGPGIPQMLGGQIAAMSSPVGDYVQHVKAGKVRLLATSGPTRSVFAPDVPTYREQGFADLVSREWFGFFLPGKTPAAVRERVSVALRRALALPEVVESMKVFGQEVESMGIREFEDLVRADSERAGQLVRALGFKADS
ncbi:MAG: twin-arginine translocation signal domain-containing protein [Burkholderiales bacterium]|nr:twin-arginine translocation signal domain-containing protein [Burkholderiales bacterium]